MGCWGHDREIHESTLPFSTKCKKYQRWYASFRSKWWAWSVAPAAPYVSDDCIQIHILPHVFMSAQSFPHTMNPGTCRTHVPQAILSELTQGLEVSVQSLETHGGMGRIYALTDPTKVLKIADVDRSWCAYEPQNYALLEQKGLPCAVMHSHCIRSVKQTYVLTVLERLDITMTALIRAAGRLRQDPLMISRVMKSMLCRLKEANVAYGDLSPDNIMCRYVDNDTYELALIDPQFMVPLDVFKRAMTPEKAEHFDTTYLALKIQSIGLLDPRVRNFTEIICKDILGYVPPPTKTREWLIHDAPIGLYLAYDVLRTT